MSNCQHPLCVLRILICDRIIIHSVQTQHLTRKSGISHFWTVFFTLRRARSAYFWFITYFYYVFSELWNDELQSRKKRKDPFSPDKKKPVVVSDILSLKLLFFLVAFTALYFIIWQVEVVMHSQIWFWNDKCSNSD